MKKRMKRFMVLVLLFCVVFSGLGLDFSYAYATEFVETTETVEETEEEEIEVTEELEETEQIESTEENDENNAAPSTEVIESTELPEILEDAPEATGWRATTAERNLYYDDFTRGNIGKKYQGETIEELLQMNAELGIEWESFFEGSCLAGTDLEGLLWMQEEGYTLEYLIKAVSEAGKGNVWHHIQGIETYEAYANQTVTFTGTTDVGHIPVFGKSNAPVYKMAIGGSPAFCADVGKHMYSGTNLTYMGEVTNSTIIKALVYAKNGGNYMFAQFYIWANGNEADYCTGYAQFVCSLNANLTYDEVAALNADNNSNFSTYYRVAHNTFSAIDSTDITGYQAYMYSNGNSSYQRLYSLYRSDVVDSEDPVVTANNSITLTKVDSQTGSAQGDATLDGAVYDLYAASDIVHPDGVTGVLYGAGSYVGTFPATSGGQATISGLYLGDYYVRERSASTGYLLDSGTYHVSLAGDGTTAVSANVTVRETVIKGNIRLVKHLQENDPSSALKPQTPEAGAEFDVILQSSGRVYAHIVTDSDGYAQANNLPYGTYTVRQTKGKEGYSFVNDFTVSVRANGRTYSYILENLNYTAQLQILKKDAVSGELVAIEGTAFEVYTADGQKVVQKILYPTKYEISTFVTDAAGTVCLPEWLAGGDYILREVKVPFGYALNTEDIPFKIARANEVKDEWGDSVIQVVCENQPVQGKLILEVTGEELIGYDSTGFIYEEVPLKDTSFEVYADEDILSPDNQTDENGERIVLYAKDQLVATITTDENGMAVLEGIPLGAYYVKEANVPEGYARNKDNFSVEFEYLDEFTPVIEKAFQIKVERQKLDANVYKASSEDGRAVSGAVIGMYAAEEILDRDGNVIVKKDALIEKAYSGNDGIAKFKRQYPFGQYYAQEISAPAGYFYSGEKEDFIFAYQGQEIERVKITKTISNTPIPSGGLDVNKSTVQMTQPGDTIKFTIDTITNGSTVYVNDFTVTDFVPSNTTLTTLWTGTYSGYRSYSVSYITNKNKEWQYWATDLNTFENNRLDVSAMGLKRGERVTAFKFEFGRVPDGFSTTSSPCYMAYVHGGLSSNVRLKSTVQLTGARGGEQYFDQAETVTTIWTGPKYEEHKEVVKVDSIPKLPIIEELEGTTFSPGIEIIPGTEAVPETEQEEEAEDCTCECTFWTCRKLRVAILIGLFMQISGGLMMYVAVKLRKKENKKLEGNEE